MIDVQYYLTTSGRNVVDAWLTGLQDERTAAKIAVRIERLALGNFGDCKPVADGVWELRIDWGPGYRVYYAMAGKSVVLLLCGGDKRKQTADINRAIGNWNDYQRRTGKR